MNSKYAKQAGKQTNTKIDVKINSNNEQVYNSHDSRRLESQTIHKQSKQKASLGKTHSTGNLLINLTVQRTAVEHPKPTATHSSILKETMANRATDRSNNNNSKEKLPTYRST